MASSRAMSNGNRDKHLKCDKAKILKSRRVPACRFRIHDAVFDCVSFQCLVPCSQCTKTLEKPPVKSQGSTVCIQCGEGAKASRLKSDRKVPSCPKGVHDGIAECFLGKCLTPCACCRISLRKCTEENSRRPFVCQKCQQVAREGEADKKRKRLSSEDSNDESDDRPNKTARTKDLVGPPKLGSGSKAGRVNNFLHLAFWESLDKCIKKGKKNNKVGVKKDKGKKKTVKTFYDSSEDDDSGNESDDESDDKRNTEAFVRILGSIMQ